VTWEKHGKNMGKTWEKHGKNMGKIIIFLSVLYHLNLINLHIKCCTVSFRVVLVSKNIYIYIY